MEMPSHRQVVWSRRAFMRFTALGSLAAVAAACAPAPATPPPAEAEPEAPAEEEEAPPPEEEAPPPTAEPTPEPAEDTPAVVGFQGLIECYAQAYTPSTVAVNPDPNAPKYTVMETLAEEWMAMHPGIELKFIPAPPGDYINWMETQLVGGTGPDIFFHWPGGLSQWADQGKVVPINDYLNMPNKYTDEGVAWMEEFSDVFEDIRSTKGNFGGVLMSMGSTGIYCNLSIFEEAGIDLASAIDPELGSPLDWATFMEWHPKLAETGKFVMSPGNALTWAWFWTVFGDQLCWRWYEEGGIDVLNYHEETPIEKQEGILTGEEIAHAYMCRDFDPFQQPEVQEIYRVVKDWSQYFIGGWAGADLGSPFELFATGELAMWWDGCWVVGNILQDTRREFEFASFWVPPITQATSELAKDPPVLPIGLGSPGGGYGLGINHKCIEKGNIEECVDWLMWVTVPEHCEEIVNEVPGLIPTMKESKALPVIASLYVGESRLKPGGHPFISPFGWFGDFSGKWGDVFRRQEQLYYLEDQSLQETMDQLSTAAAEMAPELLRGAALQYAEDGYWDLTQWECQPEV